MITPPYDPTSTEVIVDAILTYTSETDHDRAGRAAAEAGKRLEQLHPWGYRSEDKEP